MTRGTHLLIVEDEVVLRRCLAAYFEAQGLRVSQAGSITEAAELLDRSEFDAAVLDVGLPDGDGLSLLERTNADRSLVITANPDPSRFERCGVQHHLQKPVDLRALSDAVAQITHR